MRWNDQLISSDDSRLPGMGGDAVVRHFDAPEALDTRFYEVRAKSALNRVPQSSKAPFRWTVNPYRGCAHACEYCFARPTHVFLGLDAGRDFEREIVVKVNVPEVLRRDLAKSSWKGEHVALGTNTDPYQWVEGRYKLMRGIWEAMIDARNPCSVLTKSPLLLRDADLFEELCRVTTFGACLSVPTIDEKIWRATEPRTPNPRARLEAVAELNRRGIPTGVLVAPLMPGINDDPRLVEKVLEAAKDAGARDIGGQALFLAGETRGVFMDWLRDQRPDLVERYEQLYRRRSRLPESERARIEAPVRAARRGMSSSRHDSAAVRRPSRQALAPHRGEPPPGERAGDLLAPIGEPAHVGAMPVRNARPGLGDEPPPENRATGCDGEDLERRRRSWERPERTQQLSLM